MKKLVLSAVLVFSLVNAADVNNNFKLTQSSALTTIGVGSIVGEDAGVVVKIGQENITTSFLPFFNFYANISNVGYQKYSMDTFIAPLKLKNTNFNLWGGVGYEKFKYSETIKKISLFHSLKKEKKEQQLFLKYFGILDNDNNDFNPFLELDIGSKSVNLNAGVISKFKNPNFSTEFRVWKRFIYDNGKWDDIKGLFTVNYTF